MLSENLTGVAIKARNLYEESLRPLLESQHRGSFVCIEPESGEYFIGKTFDAAVNQAIDAYPLRQTFTLRIGHEAAFHLGVIRL